MERRSRTENRRGHKTARKNEISRRNFLRILAVSAVGAGAGATGLYWWINQDGEEKNIISIEPISYSPPQKTLPENREVNSGSLIEDHYPELSGETPSEQGQFRTDLQTVNWFNYSKHEFNPDAAEATIRYFEGLAKMGLRSEFTEHNNRKVVTQLYADATISQTALFIVDENQSLPKWNPAGIDGLTAKGFDEEGGQIRLVYIRTSDSENPTTREKLESKQNYVNHIFLTEACNSAVVAAPPDITKEGPEVDSSKLHHTYQDIICNSFATMLLFRQMGKSYQEYYQYEQGSYYDMSSIPGFVGKTQFGPIPEEFYQSEFPKQAINIK